ncbi:MAG: anti-sigma factor antagonist [Chloroflexi bacterium]|nr:MAG: anti-sigma factor antagonist [Chloroflexota bacterium]
MLDIHVEHDGEVVLIEVSGRVDSMTANQFGEALNQAIDEGNINIVADLSGVEYMSSAGLREIVAALKKVKRASGDLRIAQPSNRVMEVFEMAGLDTILQIFSSAQEAVGSF